MFYLPTRRDTEKFKSLIFQFIANKNRDGLQYVLYQFRKMKKVTAVFYINMSYHI